MRVYRQAVRTLQLLFLDDVGAYLLDLPSGGLPSFGWGAISDTTWDWHTYVHWGGWLKKRVKRESIMPIPMVCP